MSEPATEEWHMGTVRVCLTPVWPLHIRQVQIVFCPGFYSTMDPQDSEQVPGSGDGPHGKELSLPALPLFIGCRRKIPGQDSHPHPGDQGLQR